MVSYVQAKHAAEGCTSWGVNGENGEIVDMAEYGVWEAYSVKAQTYKTAIEVHLYCVLSSLLATWTQIVFSTQCDWLLS